MSYVVVSAEKARELAEHSLAKIKSERDLALKRFLAARTKSINKHWWNRLLKRVYTEQEVYEFSKIPNIMGISDVDIEVYSYSDNEAFAEDLLRAATLGDPLHISINDSRLLFI